MVHFSHRFTSQALEFKDGEMKIPYKYYLDGNKEGFFLDISFTHRVLTLHSSDFSSHNKIIHKYDFIISPANLPLEKQTLCKDPYLILKVVFHLYCPDINTYQMETQVPIFYDVKSQICNIISSLCDTYLSNQVSHFGQPILPLFERKGTVLLYET